MILGTSYADSPFFVQTISLDILAIDRSIMLNSVIKYAQLNLFEQTVSHLEIIHMILQYTR